jgi:phosphoadenosine phosphosulfate reductase
VATTTDLIRANQELAGKTPRQIIEWAVGLKKKCLVTTSFGPYSAVMLHLATRVQPDLPVVWVDTGYNTRETYLYAEKLIKDLKLNIKVFTPLMTAARRSALMGGIPAPDTEKFEEFTRQVKLEPFQRVLKEFTPEIWLTAIRKDETEFRMTLDIVSPAGDGLLKVAPFLNWTEIDMEGYLYEHDLPQINKYYDPTKPEANRECGLHTMDYTI